MTSFDIKPTKVRQASSSMHNSAARISTLLTEARAVQNRLPSIMSQGRNLSRGIATMTAAMQGEQKRVKDLANTLDQIIYAYEHADNISAGKGILDRLRPGSWIPWILPPGPVIPGPLWWITWPILHPLGPGAYPFFPGGGGGGGGGGRGGKDPIWQFFYKPDPEDPFKFGEGSWDYGKHGKTPDDKTKKGKGTIADRFSDFKDAHSKDHNYQGYFDENGKWHKVNQKDDDQTKKFKEEYDYSVPVEATLIGIGGSKSWSLIHGGQEGSGKYGGGSWSADVAKAEAHANASINYGNVSASAGASFTALTASGKAYLGNKDLNAHVEGEVVAGKVGAEAEASLGWRDSKGNFNPTAHAGVKAEAIAGEISGKVGADTPIGDVNVKGSLNYGVGAHLDVGVKDGKVSVDIGATIGVGGSIKVEFDFTKGAKKIGEGVKAVGKWAKSLKFW